MRKWGLPVISSLLAMGLAGGGNAVAAEAAVPAPIGGEVADSAYAELYAAMDSSLDQNRILDNTVATLGENLVRLDPSLTRIEAEFPGLSVAIARSMRPVLVDFTDRVRRAYQPIMLAALKDILTEAEARGLARAYSSPSGRRIMAGMSAGFDSKATMNAVVEGKEIDSTTVQADLAAARDHAIAQASASDLLQFGLLLRKAAAPAKLEQLKVKVAALRAQMENEPMTPAEEARAGQLVDAAIEAHVAKFDEQQ